MTIWWLRHGESTWNAAGRLQYQAAHPPLTERGHAQAAAIAGKLADLGITTIVSSPAVRARQTAEIVGARLALPVTLDENLVEKGLGEDVPGVRRRLRALIAQLPPDATTLAVTHGDAVMIAAQLLGADRPGLPDNCDAVHIDELTGDVSVIRALA